MDILSMLQERLRAKPKEEKKPERKRLQCNLNIDPALKNEIGDLKKLLFAPQYAILEHIVQIGLFQLHRTAGDVTKLQVLREHLSRDHVLALELSKEDSVLRLGEMEVETWQFLKQTQGLTTAYQRVQVAMWIYRQTGNFEPVEKARKNFILAAGNLAEFLIKTPASGFKRAGAQHRGSAGHPSESVSPAAGSEAEVTPADG